jgi:AcrR family transcriptional regulator
MGDRRGRGRPRGRASTVELDHILMQAADLFLARGYHKVSLTDVANAVGLSKTTVRYHAGSKAELFTQAMNASRQQLTRTLEAILTNADDAPEERLRAALKFGLEAGSGQLMTLAVTEEAGPFLSQAQRDSVAAARRETVQVLMQFMASLAPSPVEPDRLRVLAIAFMNLWLVRSWEAAPGQPELTSPEDTAAEIGKLLWDGLWPSHAPSSARE